jgi:hypothetical protein
MNRSRNFYKSIIVLLFSVLALSANAQPAEKSKTSYWATLLNIQPQPARPKKVITVAVIDDAFLLSHKSIKKYIYTNTNETADNFQDDDGNGFIDDLHGWDMSNGDNDVSVAPEQKDIFYHGTYVAGLITSTFERFFGAAASDFLRILPVKTTSDNAKNTYLSEGYKGLRYAIGLNPDIICCAWSGGEPTNEDKAIIAQAAQRGIIIVSSAGNLYSDKIDAPAAIPGVVAVTALDSACRKFDKSSYGTRADIAVPGKHIYGPHAAADNAFTYQDGTSPAAAIATGCFAALKALYPTMPSSELIDAMTCTATPVDSLNLTYAGKLGSGIPDVAQAINFLQDKDFKYHHFNAKSPKGKFFYDRKSKITSWDISPAGDFKGIHIYANAPEYKGKINVYSGDSLRFAGDVSELRKGVYLKGNSFKVELPKKDMPAKGTTFSYYMETIDSTTLYCSGIKYLKDPFGTITDGSGDNNYANRCEGRWQIIVPEGKRILIEFDSIDTQPNVDYVWLFEGEETIPRMTLGKFSGNTPPPHIISSSNKVLVWFVTDGSVTGKGWKLHYTAVNSK